MTSAVCSLVMIAQSILGCGFGDHSRGYVTAAECCEDCGVRSADVDREIWRLHACASWRQRDNAAHALRKFDWECHPEMLASLSRALLSDCEEEVREEAAETLAKLSPPPCVPEVHAALARAAECDPDHATRKWARRGLARIEDGCKADCGICEPALEGYQVERPTWRTDVYVLPRNGAYIVPGSRIDLPVSPPVIESTPLIMPERSIVVPGDTRDPLEALPPLDELPAPINPEPAVPPPPPAEASPFLTPPRAERRPEGRVAAEPNESEGASERVKKIASRDDEDQAREPARRRRLFPFSILGRRGR